MHVFVFEDGPERLRILQQRMIVALEVSLLNGLRKQGICLPRVLPHDRPRRPCRIAARDGLGFGVGIDAAGKNRFKMLVDAALSEPLLHERIHGKCRQVSFVEHDRVPQRDGAIVVDGFVDQVEERAGAGAAALEAVEDGGSNYGHKSRAYLDLPQFGAVGWAIRHVQCGFRPAGR